MANYSASTDYPDLIKNHSGFATWLDDATTMINTFMDYSANATDTEKNHKRAEIMLVTMQYHYVRSFEMGDGLASYTSPNGITYNYPVMPMTLRSSKIPLSIMAREELKKSRDAAREVELW